MGLPMSFHSSTFARLLGREQYETRLTISNGMSMFFRSQVLLTAFYFSCKLVNKWKPVMQETPHKWMRVFLAF